jgi:hypothetical protein
MTLGQASYYKVTFSSGQTVNSFAGVSSGQIFTLHVTNGNATFTNSASLKLAGSANYTPAAAGATITFLIEAGNAIELSRTAY